MDFGSKSLDYSLVIAGIISGFAVKTALEHLLVAPKITATGFVWSEPAITLSVIALILVIMRFFHGNSVWTEIVNKRDNEGFEWF
jgi:hypothetical protein